jgi:ketosteroid isomerase-like protein
VSRSTTEEQEIRRLFADWLRSSSQLDIEGAMRPIDPNVHSYEHVAPLEYRGIDAVRAVCQQGFDQIKGEFEWDVPDLQVIVRDDIAIAWGLNRMRYRSPSAPEVENWSRSTRVFQKKEGTWKMIHQHLSLPADPETGQVKADLKP